MKRIFKQNAGLTLIELVVAIAMATVVTAAATSVLLMGLRINRQTGDTASQQITVRALLTKVENILSEGNIKSYEADAESWRIISTSDSVLLSYRYDPEQQSGVIYVGDCGDDDTEATGTPILTGLLSSFVQQDNDLFTVSVETKTGMYSTSVYCRVVNFENDITVPENATREAFIGILRTQYRSRGEIIYTTANPKQPEDFTYYSEWYIGGYYNDDRWNEDTAWCACFVSWALDQTGMPGPADNCPEGNSEHDHSRWFADVEEFRKYFINKGQWQDRGNYTPREGEANAGDLIFFNTDNDADADHIGVVMKVEDGWVYTIEGNNNNRVGIRSYRLTDKSIIGYGVLPWAN